MTPHRAQGTRLIPCSCARAACSPTALGALGIKLILHSWLYCGIPAALEATAIREGDVALRPYVDAVADPTAIAYAWSDQASTLEKR